MAKVSSVQRNLKRIKKNKSLENKRNMLKGKILDKNTSLEERFATVIKLASMPRNSAKTRIRNRCELTGRPRGYFRKFKLSRNMLRELAGQAMLPGLIKSSW
ncbi:MAG: 30S ribosomal protein S14 [Alphaproteobacteria bacterium]|nr:30S ribosomal protein S14 [Alphaproteobacteria bacterium]